MKKLKQSKIKMEIQNFKNEHNILLNRHEIRFIAKAGKTPTFAEVTKLAAEQAKKPEENMHIETIKGKFGRESFLVKAYAYESKEDREKNHPVKQKKAQLQAPKAE